MSSVETKHNFYRVCDGCGKHSPYASSYNEALDKAKAEGWTHIADTNKDYCIQCRLDRRKYIDRPKEKDYDRAN